MARGFSHSGRGGGGGGSFGGGISFGGGGFRSSRSSSSGGHYHRSHRPWRIPIFGRTVILTSGGQALVSLMMIFLFMAAVLIFMYSGNLKSTKAMIVESEEYVKKYEEYDKTFATIISKAKLGEDGDGYFVVDASFRNKSYQSYDDDPTSSGYYLTDIYENSQYYYFIVYEFSYDYNGQSRTWNDSTFTQFTIYNIKDKIDTPTSAYGTLEVAYTIINGEVWAINTDYSLEKNLDYKYEVDYLESLKAEKSFFNKAIVISAIVIVVIVAILVLYCIKKYKQAKKDQAVEDAKNDAEIAEARAKADIAERQAKQINRVCKYCGASVPDGDDECPSCGSRHFNNE